MQICQNHWDKLREAIVARGLGHLISPSGEKALNMVEFSNKTLSDPKTDFFESYDPLLAANFCIWNVTVEYMGLSALQADSTCPLCAMDDHERTCKNPDCLQSGDKWIEYAADGQVEVAKQKGFTGGLVN